MQKQVKFVRRGIKYYEPCFFGGSDCSKYMSRKNFMKRAYLVRLRDERGERWGVCCWDCAHGPLGHVGMDEWAEVPQKEAADA